MKRNTILIIIICLATAGAAYFYFFTGTGNDAPITAVPQASNSQIKFDAATSKLPTSLDTSIFSDPHFTSLVDITQPIQNEPAGRIDPLAPLSGGAGSL